MKYYSATTNAFYDDAIIETSQMPEDAVVVTDEEFAELMAKQQEGYVIVADTDGTPTYIQQTCGQCTCISHELVKASSDVLGHIKVDGTNVALNERGEITLPVLDGYVDKTSDQTITGNKTLDTTNSELIFLNQDATEKNHTGFIKRTQNDLKIGYQENAPNGAILKAISIKENGIYASRGNATDDQGSEEIATKGFVNSPNFSLNVVHKTGEETISDVKTFSVSPLVPTPAADAEGQEAVNAEWVKANAGGGGASLPLFLTFWSDHLLNDVSYLRADTFSWHSGAVYEAAYNYLSEEYNNPSGTAKTETIGSQTISYRESPNGLKICLPDQQIALLSAYDETGVTWFYVLDEANEQFKLPRTKYDFTGFRDTVGGYVPESLPNLTGNLTGFPPKNSTEVATADGVFEVTETYSTAAGNISATGSKVNFDASRSSSAYQDGAPVQQKATQMYLYFYVGRYKQSAVEQTAGLNAELFNGKADIDLSNVSANIDYIVASGTSDDGQLSYALTKKGLLVHWGRYNSKNGDTTITFMHPYADTNYVVTFAFENSTSTGAVYVESLAANTKTETSFTNRDAGVFARSFIAIGKGATE